MVAACPRRRVRSSVMASSVAAARPGDLRRRLWRHYLPIAAASAMVFAVFLGVPSFDANRYEHASAIFVKGISGVWPAGDGGPIDQGPGIPADDQPHVFDRFYRAAARAMPGSGVGLAIVKQVADSHGRSVADHVQHRPRNVDRVGPSRHM